MKIKRLDAFSQRIGLFLPISPNGICRFSRADSRILGLKIENFHVSFLSKTKDHQEKTHIFFELFSAYFEREMAFYSVVADRNLDFLTLEQIQFLFRGVLEFNKDGSLFTFFNHYWYVSPKLNYSEMEKTILCFVIKNYGSALCMPNNKINFYEIYLAFFMHAPVKNLGEISFYDFEIYFRYLFNNFFFSVMIPNEPYSNELTYVETRI